MPETFDELLTRFPPAVAALAQQVRQRVAGLLPDPVEDYEGGDLGIGWGRGYRGAVFVVSPGKTGVRLGLSQGATLDDPHGVLEGSGRVHRFLRVTSAEQLDRPEVDALLRAQVAARLPDSGGA